MDSFFLHAAGGSVYNLGSFLEVSEPLDLGFAALDQPVYAESLARDGGVFGFESSRIRTWQLPLVLPSGADGKSLAAFQAALRLAARPGPWKLVAQPQGVPSAEAVHFDGLSGRWRPAYHTREWAVGRTRGTLELDTQPFGYWPTEILLASVAPASIPFDLTWNPASIIGDVPALARLTFVATQGEDASQFGDSGINFDSLWWGLGHASGATTFLNPSGFYAATSSSVLVLPILAATKRAEVGAPRGIALDVAISPTHGQWGDTFRLDVSAPAERLYRGRWRALGWFRVLPSQAIPWQVALDTALSRVERLATAGFPATVVPVGNPSWETHPSLTPTAFQLVDLGELALPRGGSGAPSANFSFRVWTKAGTTNQGVASPRVQCGGIHLLPLDEDAAIIPQGLLYPTWYNVIATDTSGAVALQHTFFAGRVVVDGITRGDALQFSVPSSNIFTQDLGRHYRGCLSPELIPRETDRLTVGVGGHVYSEAGATALRFHGGPYRALASVEYRPRFSFVKGL
ncbi:MAG: hypothetical protein ACRDM7_02890 [Thermoleophilaceae bacterium]